MTDKEYYYYRWLQKMCMDETLILTNAPSRASIYIHKLKNNLDMGRCRIPTGS